MKISSFFFIVAIVFVFGACDTFFSSDQNEAILAQVGSKKLTVSQLEIAIPPDMVEIDSISFAQKYIEKWVKNQLLLEKAELNLDKQMQREIGSMIDNYRTSLMLFKYQQMFIEQKMDTIVTDSQLEEYYNLHSGNFKLDSSVIKSIYIQIPKSASDRYKIRLWLQSSSEENLIALEDYCYQNARNFSMGGEWQYFGTLLSHLPKNIKDQDQFLKYNKYIETTDSIYAYYVSIRDYKLTNDTTPLIFVDGKVRDIILNHRKVKLIEDLENNIYNDAVDKKKFIIHTN